MNIFYKYKEYHYFDSIVAGAISYIIHVAVESQYALSLASCTRVGREYKLVFTCVALPPLHLLNRLSKHFEGVSVDIKNSDVTISVSWIANEFPF